MSSYIQIWLWSERVVIWLFTAYLHILPSIRWLLQIARTTPPFRSDPDPKSERFSGILIVIGRVILDILYHFDDNKAITKNDVVSEAFYHSEASSLRCC